MVGVALVTQVVVLDLAVWELLDKEIMEVLEVEGGLLTLQLILLVLLLLEVEVLGALCQQPM